jgi:hypothetical protein
VYAGATLVIILIASVVGALHGLGLSLLTLAAGALLGVIALFWSSVRNLSGETPLSLDEALGLGAPSAEEEQKRSILRALKDLEFERSVGKISEQDYVEFSTRYRADAKRLIAAVDDTIAPAQALAQSLVAERLTSLGLTAASGPSSDTSDAPSEATATSSESTSSSYAAVADEHERVSESNGPAARLSSEPRPQCPACATPNDPDARFCKTCGVELAQPQHSPPVSPTPIEETPS